MRLELIYNKIRTVASVIKFYCSRIISSTLPTPVTSWWIGNYDIIRNLPNTNLKHHEL